jgi:hypothetical protein
MSNFFTWAGYRTPALKDQDFYSGFLPLDKLPTMGN